VGFLEFNEQVLVLKVGRFKETDCWVRLFSPSMGIMTAFAFGGSRSRRRFLGCLDSLNHVLFRIKPARGGRYYSLEEGALLNGFPGLRRDSLRMGIAVNCLKFVEMVHVGAQSAASSYELLLDVLTFLDGQRGADPLLPLFFRARVACEQGYSPQVEACASCALDLDGMTTPAFSVDGGRVYCQNCRPPGEKWMRVHPESLKVLSALQRDGSLIFFPPELCRRGRQDFYALVDAFVQFHLGLLWERGRFRRI
jgi:DNA repair protein RecO (recombination protein O)